MSTLEEKILDGPRVQYCDAEDDDIRIGDEPERDQDDQKESKNNASDLFVRPDQEQSKSRTQAKIGSLSTNTGPKGVIEDFRRQSSKSGSKQIDNIEAEFEQLMKDDEILKEFTERRLAMQETARNLSFGTVKRLKTGSELLDAIDKERPEVLILVHIYTNFSRPCKKVDACLDELAADLKHIKFVTLDASSTGLSANFKENGVPALLAYRNQQLVKSLVQLEDLLDKDFDANQLKELMEENGLV